MRGHSEVSHKPADPQSQEKRERLGRLHALDPVGCRCAL